MANILIIDDEPSILDILASFLKDQQHRVTTAATGGEGLTSYFRQQPDLVLLDLRLPDLNGVDVLKRIQNNDHPAKVIIMTAYQSMDTAIQAMKSGAYDYIRKPLDIDELDAAITRALHVAEMEQDPPAALPSVALEDRHAAIIGNSRPMLEIFKQIGLVCQNRVQVLIQGETGTGKELIARVIHRNSAAHTAPFITVDCSAIVENLIESELFGHEKGSFTGASQVSKGKIELAGSGTLFLDEIGELPLSVQGAFLGFLQRREYMRVGGHQLQFAQCRVIAATHRNLAEMVQHGLFREDLYYRLRVVSIRVPPLRERLEDLPTLVQHFLAKLNADLGTVVSAWQDGVMECLSEHPWTGNVRELENVLTEAVVQAKSKVLLTEDIERLLHHYHSAPIVDQTSPDLADMEKTHIETVLREVKWHRSAAAKQLGISLPTLRDKIRKYEIDPQ